jgi:hypothetical protein
VGNLWEYFTSTSTVEYQTGFIPGRALITFPSSLVTEPCTSAAPRPSSKKHAIGAKLRAERWTCEAFARDGWCVCQHRGPRMRARLDRGLEMSTNMVRATTLACLLLHFYDVLYVDCTDSSLDRGDAARPRGSPEAPLPVFASGSFVSSLQESGIHAPAGCVLAGPASSPGCRAG